jgi:hypothetical protein
LFKDTASGWKAGAINSEARDAGKGVGRATGAAGAAGKADRRLPAKNGPGKKNNHKEDVLCQVLIRMVLKIKDPCQVEDWEPATEQIPRQMTFKAGQAAEGEGEWDEEHAEAREQDGAKGVHRDPGLGTHQMH